MEVKKKCRKNYIVVVLLILLLIACIFAIASLNCSKDGRPRSWLKMMDEAKQRENIPAIPSKQ